MFADAGVGMMGLRCGSAGHRKRGGLDVFDLFPHVMAPPATNSAYSLTVSNSADPSQPRSHDRCGCRHLSPDPRYQGWSLYISAGAFLRHPSVPLQLETVKRHRAPSQDLA